MYCPYLMSIYSLQKHCAGLWPRQLTWFFRPNGHHKYKLLISLRQSPMQCFYAEYTDIGQSLGIV